MEGNTQTRVRARSPDRRCSDADDRIGFSVYRQKTGYGRNELPSGQAIAKRWRKGLEPTPLWKRLQVSKKRLLLTQCAAWDGSIKRQETSRPVTDPADQHEPGFRRARSISIEIYLRELLINSMNNG